MLYYWQRLEVIVDTSTYVPRIIDKQLATYLNTFGAVLIEGPRWCGKTWTAINSSQSTTDLSDSETLFAVKNSYALALEGSTPHLIDEWQEIPQLWDSVRHRIDQNAGMPGQYILTGSAVPPNHELIHHSGAGRIARLRMRPMSLYEQGLVSGGISLSQLFESNTISSLQTHAKISDYATWVCQGGWPILLHLTRNSITNVAEQYVQAFESVIEDARLQVDNVMALMRALAYNCSQAPTYKTLLKDMQAIDELGKPLVSEKTISSYITFLINNYMIEPLGGWVPSLRAKERLRVKPKYYFCDPSIAAALIGATPTRLLNDTQTLGLLFETLVIRDLRTFTSALSVDNARLYYYRDYKDLEVDIVIELPDGRWGAFEIKLSHTKVDDAARSKLSSFVRKVQNHNYARNPEPSFLGFIVGEGPYAYKDDKGYLIIPLEALEP